MTHIYFVRHAEPNYDNHDDSLRELSETGMADRKLVASFLTNKEIDIVLSSPYKRAVDTIKEFADAYGYEIGTINDFRERKVDNCWIEDFYSFTKRQWEDFDYKFSDGETLHEVQNRNIAALRQVLRVYENKNIVIGSHGTALSTIINYFQPAFGFKDFEKIRALMPWIVHFEFEGEMCMKIEGINLFDETKSNIFKEGGN